MADCPVRSVEQSPSFELRQEHPSRITTGNWSAVQQDSQTYSDNGATYYRYFAKLQVAIPAPVNGTITVPPLSWFINCTTSLLSQVSVNARGTVTINGQEIVQVGPFRTV